MSHSRPMVVCPFNEGHIMSPDSLPGHIKRVHMQDFKYIVPTKFNKNRTDNFHGEDLVVGIEDSEPGTQGTSINKSLDLERRQADIEHSFHSSWKRPQQENSWGSVPAWRIEPDGKVRTDAPPKPIWQQWQQYQQPRESWNQHETKPAMLDTSSSKLLHNRKLAWSQPVAIVKENRAIVWSERKEQFSQQEQQHQQHHQQFHQQHLQQPKEYIQPQSQEQHQRLQQQQQQQQIQHQQQQQFHQPNANMNHRRMSPLSTSQLLQLQSIQKEIDNISGALHYAEQLASIKSDIDLNSDQLWIPEFKHDIAALRKQMDSV